MKNTEMKTNIKIYENSKLIDKINFKTKKAAEKYKKSYLGRFTVCQKVKNKIEVILSKGNY